MVMGVIVWRFHRVLPWFSLGGGGGVLSLWGKREGRIMKG